MNNQQGILIKTVSGSEFAETIKDKNWGKFLTDLCIRDGNDFLTDIQCAKAPASGQRSYFYMSYNYKEARQYVTNASRDLTYRLSVYGVKGGMPIKRSFSYDNEYLQKSEDLENAAFMDYVFGTDYLHPEELEKIPTEEEAQARLRTDLRRVSREVEDKPSVILLTERIWTIREQNTRARIVLVLEDAENDSMDLLRQIYLMLPPRLRVQTGFQTNVTLAELDNIIQKGMGIYITTMSRSVAETLTPDILSQMTDAVVLVDENRKDGYKPDIGRLETLTYHCRQLGTVTELCMDYAEKKVMEQRGKSYSSFAFYGDILKAAYADDLLWWRNKELKTLEKICSAYQGQREITAISVLHDQAVLGFYQNHLAEGELAQQLLEMAIEPDSITEQAREFLWKEMSYGHEMEVISDYARKRDEEAAALEQRLVEERNQGIEEALLDGENRRRALEADWQVRLDQLTAEKEQQISNLRKKNEDQVKAFRSEKEQLQSQLANERVKFKKDKLNIAHQELKEEYENLQEDLQRTEGRLDDAKDRVRRTRIVRNIFCTCTVLFAVAAAGAAYFAVTQKNAKDNLQKNYDELESERTDLQSKNDTLDGEKKEIEAERDDLIKDNQELRTENESLKTENESLKKKESEANSEPKDTDSYSAKKIMY